MGLCYRETATLYATEHPSPAHPAAPLAPGAPRHRVPAPPGTLAFTISNHKLFYASTSRGAFVHTNRSHVPELGAAGGARRQGRRGGRRAPGLHVLWHIMITITSPNHPFIASSVPPVATLQPAICIWPALLILIRLHVRLLIIVYRVTYDAAP